MKIEALAVEIGAVNTISVCGNNGKTGDYLNALTEHILKARIVGILVVSVERKHRHRHFIHNRGRGRFHYYIFGKPNGQTALFCKQVAEIGKLGLCGKSAEQEQIYAFLKAKAVLGTEAVDKRDDIHTSVFELTVVSYFFTLVNYVSVSITDIGDTRCDARAVHFAQTALNAIAIKCALRDIIGGFCNLNAFLKRFLIFLISYICCLDIQFRYTSIRIKNGKTLPIISIYLLL